MEEKDGAVQTTAQKNTSENKISYFVLEGILNHFAIMNKRLFILSITILVAWLLTIAGFIWYLSLPVEDYSGVSVENNDGNANYIGNDMIGDFNYGKDN